jgi:uncharacterized membrane protein (DUF485 family)
MFDPGGPVSSAQFEGGQAAPTSDEARYAAMQQNPDFQDLRRRYRGWVLPVAAGSLVWYLAYVLLAAYAPGFMGTKAFGNINIGLILGLLQFVTTFAITALYVRYADSVLDPASARIRAEFEGGRR